ncbi:ragulator complex protein LAMTOR5 homolog [Daphnia pulex]|uniref:Late endosomal/lysosomal adaptor and MAPK and MTOR activator 5 n=1 Tax=Daphnia pulex TaxID=6669 RepID=E9HIJ4_DAPPU|nr:ragulator complex protein LAMTOR5 homolog [Daphnia pulex]XP_046642546.1 ragulator complex protein LAMTOR5 homolog [Daphnia pulicaria]EFX68450.1 hypothetical protein DAPPUDRAFT_330100 [Daphnia pulex]|eukprot:EFX68450.1 hypothetical protein DAPPUDRAFT_330100 [Daphnia pulex]
MDKEVQKCVEELMTSPGVVGVLCADRQGMCLTSQGVANSNYSGSLTSLSHLATTLEPGKGDPVILFENHESQCLIHQNMGMTLAVYKTNT